MRHLYCILVLFLAYVVTGHSQQFSEAAAYNNFLVEKHGVVMQANMDYFAKLVHSNSARKIEKLRMEVIANINAALSSYQKSSYKGTGGEEMQKEAYTVMALFKKLFEIDLLEVVKMSDRCEDSYQALELYYAAQDEAHEKLRAASQQFDEAQKKFADLNNMKIVAQEDKNADKIERASQVSKYQRSIHLSYFRVSKDNGRFMKALEQKDLATMKKELMALQEDVMITLKELNALKAFEGEDGYRLATLEATRYLDGMANNEYKTLIAYLEKEEKSRTQKDVDAYNAVVAKMNKEGNRHVNSINVTQQKLLEKMVARKF